MAAKPLDIWRTSSSTHWQYPPKRPFVLLHSRIVIALSDAFGRRIFQEPSRSGKGNSRQSQVSSPSAARNLSTALRAGSGVFCKVGGDAAGATFVRSTLPVVYAVVVPALRKVREGRGTRSCGGFRSLKAGPPPMRAGRAFSSAPVRYNSSVAALCAI